MRSFPTPVLTGSGYTGISQLDIKHPHKTIMALHSSDLRTNFKAWPAPKPFDGYTLGSRTPRRIRAARKESLHFLTGDLAAAPRPESDKRVNSCRFPPLNQSANGRLHRILHEKAIIFSHRRIYDVRLGIRQWRIPIGYLSTGAGK